MDEKIREAVAGKAWQRVHEDSALRRIENRVITALLGESYKDVLSGNAAAIARVQEDINLTNEQRAEEFVNILKVDPRMQQRREGLPVTVERILKNLRQDPEYRVLVVRHWKQVKSAVGANLELLEEHVV